MQDAIIFVVMVSFSSVIIVPSLTSNIALDSSVQKHREELSDETLLMLINSRADNFGYTLAGEQIRKITGINIDYDKSNLSLIESILKTFLGREQKHKTYSDLCVENLVCQLKIFGNRINIFTSDFEKSLKEELNIILKNYLGEKYGFNLKAIWKPIYGIDFGGKIEIGAIPPENTHVSKTYLTLPDTFFSDWFNNIDYYVDYKLKNISFLNPNKDNLREQFKNLTFEIITDLTINGFNDNPSLVEKTIDYVFSPIEDCIDNIFGSSSNMILSPLNTIYPEINNDLNDLFVEKIKESIGSSYDYTNYDKLNLSSSIFSLKEYFSFEIEKLLFSIFENSINDFSYVITDKINDSFNIEVLKENFTDFIKEHINPLRAELILTIWEIRG